MTRKKDTQTISIFEYITEQRATSSASSAPGSCDIDAKLRAAIALDIKHARDEQGRELGQPEVAGRMTVLAGEEVTSAMLYSWTADSKKKHNMPGKLISALTSATNSHHAQDVVALGAGGFYMPSPEALDSEIYRITRNIKEQHREKKKREQLRDHILGEVSK
jgi:hypothetical protein